MNEPKSIEEIARDLEYNEVEDVKTLNAIRSAQAVMKKASEELETIVRQIAVKKPADDHKAVLSRAIEELTELCCE